MKAATQPVQRPRDARLLVVDGAGRISHHPRSALADLLVPGDLVVANDAATLPASLAGRHLATGAAIEVRLAGRRSLAADDVACFLAVVFGAGDWRTRTEDRPLPPPLAAGDTLALGPLAATVVRIVAAPRLVELRFAGAADAIRAGIARHGRPVQYAHVAAPLALWDVWTTIAAPSGRVRGAFGRLRPRLATARPPRRARHRLRDADPCRRPVVDRRCRARCATAVRRAVPPAGGDGRRGAGRPSARRSCRRDRHDGRARPRTRRRATGRVTRRAGSRHEPARPIDAARRRRRARQRHARAGLEPSRAAARLRRRRDARPDRCRARLAFARLPHARVRRLGAGRARRRAARAYVEPRSNLKTATLASRLGSVRTTLPA